MTFDKEGRMIWLVGFLIGLLFSLICIAIHPEAYNELGLPGFIIASMVTFGGLLNIWINFQKTLIPSIIKPIGKIQFRRFFSILTITTFVLPLTNCGNGDTEKQVVRSCQLPQHQQPSSPEFQYTKLPDAEAWEVKLSTPIEPRQEHGCLWVPYMPEQIQEIFPLPTNGIRPDRVPLVSSCRRPCGYDIMDLCTAELLLLANDVQYNDSIILSGGQYAAFQRVPKYSKVFDPIEFGYLIQYQGVYLAITFLDRSMVKIHKLKPWGKLDPMPATIKVPKFGKEVKFRWTVEGEGLGLDFDWIPGKRIEASSQNAGVWAKSMWRGGKTVKLPSPTHHLYSTINTIRVRATDPKTKEKLWEFSWCQPE